MQKVWLTRNKGGEGGNTLRHMHATQPEESLFGMNNWTSDDNNALLKQQCIILLGRDLEPGECSPPLYVLDTTDEIAARYEKSLELLELCYEAGHRQGWEDGPTSEEVFGKVNHFLSGERLEKEIFPLKDNWIPVEERLPEERGFYQATRIWDGDYWVIESSWNGENWQHEDVIAWKPLPEPYQPPA